MRILPSCYFLAYFFFSNTVYSILIFHWFPIIARFDHWRVLPLNFQWHPYLWPYPIRKSTLGTHLYRFHAKLSSCFFFCLVPEVEHSSEAGGVVEPIRLLGPSSAMDRNIPWRRTWRWWSGFLEGFQELLEHQKHKWGFYMRDPPILGRFKTTTQNRMPEVVNFGWWYLGTCKIL